MTFTYKISLKNEGKFGVHIQTSVGVYLKDEIIDEYEWDGDDDSYLNSGQELQKIYEISLTPTFIHKLTDMERKKLYIKVEHDIATDKETIAFIAKKISSHFKKSQIQKQSEMYYTTTLYFSCLREAEDEFSCRMG